MKKFILLIVIAVHLVPGCVKESNFTSSIEIDAPAFLIFDLLSNPNSIVANMSGLFMSSNDDLEINELHNQNATIQITEFQRNQKLKFRHMDGSSLETTIILTPVSKNKTIYTVETSLTDFAFEGETLQNLEQNIKNFKLFSEQKFIYYDKLKTLMNQ